MDISDREYKELKELSDFAKNTLSILSSFSTEESDKIKSIRFELTKYSAANRYYNSCIGIFK